PPCCRGKTIPNYLMGRNRSRGLGGRGSGMAPPPGTVTPGGIPSAESTPEANRFVLGKIPPGSYDPRRNPFSTSSQERSGTLARGADLHDLPTARLRLRGRENGETGET